ncbi:MAG: SUKH-4 family immunity protein [Actinomycetota bacterium]|nr:SUKH-4 family immunity protein [Actinomycetota bacterium]
MNSSPNESWVGNITADEVREVWNGQIRPITAGLISPDVSPATRQFLTEVGLPTTDVLNMSFAHDSRLSSTVRRKGGREYLVVTDDESNVVFAIDVKSDQVVDITRSLPNYPRFINSDVAALVFFIGLLKKNVMGLEEVNEEILTDAVDSVRISMRDLDPAAMEGKPWNDLLDDLETQYE